MCLWAKPRSLLGSQGDIIRKAARMGGEGPVFRGPVMVGRGYYGQSLVERGSPDRAWLETREPSEALRGSERWEARARRCLARTSSPHLSRCGGMDSGPWGAFGASGKGQEPMPKWRTANETSDRSCRARLDGWVVASGARFGQFRRRAPWGRGGARGKGGSTRPSASGRPGIPERLGVG